MGRLTIVRNPYVWATVAIAVQTAAALLFSSASAVVVTVSAYLNLPTLHK